MAPAPTPPPALPPGMADFLVLVRDLMRVGGSSVTTPPGQETPVASGQSQGPLSKEKRKFYKLGTPPPPEASESDVPAPNAPAPVSPAPAQTVAGDDPATPEAELFPVKAGRPRRPDRLPGLVEERSSGRRRSPGSGRRRLFVGLGIASTVGAFLIGLSLGRPAAAPASTPRTLAGPAGAPGPTAPSPALATSAAATRALTPDEDLRRALATIDQAEAAHGAGDWVRMGTLLDQADREAGPLGVPGLLFRRAENAARRGDAPTANALAQRSTEAGEELAKAYALRAVLAQRSKRPLIAMSLLETAGRLDPFDGRYPYYQGQTLRAQGKLQEAAIRLRRAVDRAEDPAQLENYGVALRLTQIELGQDESFAEELTRRLAQPYPAPDWLVTAAARELQAGRPREGADFLRRALVQSGPNFAASRLGDVFFRRFADQPDMIPLFAQYLPPPAAAPAPAAPAYPPPMPTPYPSLQSPSNELIIPPLRGPEDASARPADPGDVNPKQP